MFFTLFLGQFDLSGRLQPVTGNEQIGGLLGMHIPAKMSARSLKTDIARTCKTVVSPETHEFFEPPTK